MRRIKQYAFRKKNLLLRLTAIMLAVFGSVALLSQAAFAQNTYMITDGDRVTYHTSYATDPVEVLDEAGFELGKDDTYTTQESGGVSEIVVQRVQMITIDNGGQVMTTGTMGETVEQLLTRLNITLDAQASLNCELTDETYDGMEIVVSRTSYVTETYTQVVPYDIKYYNDSSLTEGEEEILTAGTDGEMLCTAQVTYVNGQETARTVISSTVTQAPVAQQVAVGTAPEREQFGDVTIGNGIITTGSGEVLTYTRRLTVLATAYSCEGYTGTTATGTVARVGAIAVDPSVIPLGTRMFIVSEDGSVVYGIATAEDTGALITGYRIDLYFDTEAECYSFGARNCQVYILG